MSKTYWLKPAHLIKGQDHLASRAVCESIYSQLLPGLTNVTDRIRYYTFYPWLLWAHEQQGLPLTRNAVMDTIRRGECLLTMVSTLHGLDGAQREHGVTMIGNTKLRHAVLSAVEGEPQRLSAYADASDENKLRYFMNPWGGLAQYYLGQLIDLDVLARGPAKGVRVAYTPELGVTLAKAFDKGVDREAFFAALERDVVDRAALDNLSEFCPCGLLKNPVEHALLLDFAFNRPGPLCDDEVGDVRRDTMCLVLDLAAALSAGERGAEIKTDQFRAAVYTGTLPSGVPWALPERLERLRRKWGTYQRNELLSLAVQTLFWAGLNGLWEDRAGRVAGEAEYGTWMAGYYASALPGGDPHRLFADLVDDLRGQIVPLGAWEDPSHEISRAQAIRSTVARTASSQPERVEAVRAALDVLLALAARDDPGRAPYGTIAIRPAMLSRYPINLASFRTHSAGHWCGLNMSELLAELACAWGMRVHLRVALRKLRQNTKDTFQLRPVDDGFLAAEDTSTTTPSYGSPRFNQALQALRDLGALEGAGEGNVRLTDLGHSMLEAYRG